MHDVVIVGSGVAGVGAALELVSRGVRPLMLDVGNTSEHQQPAISDNLYEYRKRHDCFDLLIGARHQGLRNFANDDYLPPRLLAPSFDYVTKDTRRLSPIVSTEFAPILSFAKGGLANAWGAGLYRYDDDDLASFPFRATDLLPYYDTLTKEIGISGVADDLSRYFGPDTHLQPPLRLSGNVQKLYDSYQKKRAIINRHGIYVGHARVAALSEAKDGRPACSYSNLEFCQNVPFIYTPAFTLDRLVADDCVEYRKGILVESWQKKSGGIQVNAVQLNNGGKLAIQAKKVILAAGTINSSKIVLKSRREFGVKLQLLDNHAVQVPLILPSSIGMPLETHTFGLVQLNLIWESEAHGARLQGSLLELSAVSRAELFQKFPLSSRGNIALIRYLAPAVLAMQFQFPASLSKPNFLSLDQDNRLHIDGQPNSADVGGLGKLFAALRRLGAWSHPVLCVRAPNGLAMHYAGTLPMSHSPMDYQCNSFGELHGARNIFIADGSVFPALPAKNASFTLMANAMRIANHVANALREEV